MKKEIKPPYKLTHLQILVIYLVFCFCTIITAGRILNSIVEKNNIHQISITTGLMAEKVNDSLELMADSAAQLARILSINDTADPKISYDLISNSASTLSYTSLGIIEKSGVIYGKFGDRLDIEKHGLADKAAAVDGNYISEPYRSSTLGIHVLSMFAPFYHNDEHAGNVYISYPLTAIQEFAKSDMLDNQMEIFLEDSLSGNFINCIDKPMHSLGSWNNINLFKGQIKCLKGYDYSQWQRQMRSGAKNGAICYQLDGITYTQVFEKLDSMHDWCVVVRIPNEYLTSTTKRYTRGIIFCCAILLAATFLVILLFGWEEHEQKKNLQILSTVEPLTETMNRRAFQAKAEEYFSSGNEHQAVLMFIDIDHFKLINDTYGHAAGDFLLCYFASSLQKIFFKNSIISRMGGDEFVIFLSYAITRPEMDILLARLRKELQNICLENGEIITITFSAGLAVNTSDAQTLEAMKRHADKALYYVKEHGRNAAKWFDDIEKDVT